jgi:hypothetical protein
MLNKALDVNAALKSENDVLRSENAGWKRYAEAADALDKAKDRIIEAEEKRYERLAKTKCSTSTFLLFVYKRKTCF